jgi:NitT/TauT family transport system substrate-binding protein
MGDVMSIYSKVLQGIAFCFLMQSAQAATDVRLSLVSWIGYSPLYIADSKKLFTPYNINVKIDNLSDNALMVKALKEGKADAATLTYGEVIPAISEGLNIKVVLPIDYSNGGDAIVAPKTIANIAALKGKKVGFNFLAPQDVLLAYALKKNGLTQKDIIGENIPADSIQGMLESAKIDAGVTYEPNVSTITGLAGGQKFHVIFSSKEAPGLITDLLVFTQDFISKYPEAVKGVIQGYLAGLKFMKEQPEEAHKIIAAALGIPKTEVPAQLATVYIPQLSEMGILFQPSEDMRSLFASGKLIGELLLSKQAIKSIPKIEDTFDASFLSGMK